jgi:sugar lactone lactonase YvrE
MKKKILQQVLVFLFIMVLQAGLSYDAIAGNAKGSFVISDKTITGFMHPESVAFDPKDKVLYVSQFGSVLNPTLKDGKGKISKVSLKGKIIEDNIFSVSGYTLNKPKGIWIENGKLWVVDIGLVWIFDLKTLKGRAIDLPGAVFANDPTVIDNNDLFISDSSGKKIYLVQPADFLNHKIEPKISLFARNLFFEPNGLCPGRDGSLFAVGFDMNGSDQGLYSFDREGNPDTHIKDLGMLDGLVQLKSGSFLITDWKSKTLLKYSQVSGIKNMASGFEGPADFCIVDKGDKLLVVVPDLVKSEIRFIRIAK